MEKYLGIVKVTEESMIGVKISILSMFSNNKSTIKKWFSFYPKSEKLLLENNRKLNSFFEDFEDYSIIYDGEEE